MTDGNIDIPFRNVGDEWHSFTGKIPVGGVPYCGQEVTRSTYADLWTWVQAQGLVKTEDEWQALNTSQNGNVPFYSSGDGSTTFRMPKVVGYIKGAASQTESGGYTAEGLPNITGEHGVTSERSFAYNTAVSGAFDLGSSFGKKYGYTDSSGKYDQYLMSLDASRSSSIYGNSDHVTPETATVLFGVYAFGEITNVGALDADTLATGLATVEANLSAKLGRDDKAEIVGWGIPNYNAGVQKTWKENITATRDCFVVTRTVGYNATITLWVNGVAVLQVLDGGSGAPIKTLSLFVKKGDVYKGEGNITSTITEYPLY